MDLISEQARATRNAMQTDFGPLFPRSFRALQDMALAASRAYKSSGKRAWFGMGRDLSLETMRGFQDSVFLLVSNLSSEGFINLPAANGLSEEDQVKGIVRAFFVAYPNWKDAEETWGIFAGKIVSSSLLALGYDGERSKAARAEKKDKYTAANNLAVAVAINPVYQGGTHVMFDVDISCISQELAEKVFSDRDAVDRFIYVIDKRIGNVFAKSIQDGSKNAFGKFARSGVTRRVSSVNHVTIFTWSHE